jgi:hypothetical protein
MGAPAGGGSDSGRTLVWSVHTLPSYHRITAEFDGSSYHPASVMRIKLHTTQQHGHK